MEVVNALRIFIIATAYQDVIESSNRIQLSSIEGEEKCVRESGEMGENDGISEMCIVR